MCDEKGGSSDEGIHKINENTKKIGNENEIS